MESFSGTEYLMILGIFKNVLGVIIMFKSISCCIQIPTERIMGCLGFASKQPSGGVGVRAGRTNMRMR